MLSPRYDRALVLGAGSTLAVAFNAGVLCELEARGEGLRETDLVVGTSAGAVTAAFVRSWLDARSMVDAVYSGLRDARGPLADLLELARTLDGLRVPELVRMWRNPELLLDPASMLAQVVPEEWPDHTAVVAFDLVKRRRRLLDASSGVSFLTAVAASMAIPGVFKPPVIDGRPHVDGGMLSRSNAQLVVGRADEIVIVNPRAVGQWPGRRHAHLTHLRLASLRVDIEMRNARTTVYEPDIELFSTKFVSTEERVAIAFQHGIAAVGRSAQHDGESKGAGAAAPRVCAAGAS